MQFVFQNISFKNRSALRNTSLINYFFLLHLEKRKKKLFVFNNFSVLIKRYLKKKELIKKIIKNQNDNFFLVVSSELFTSIIN